MNIGKIFSIKATHTWPSDPAELIVYIIRQKLYGFREKYSMSKTPHFVKVPEGTYSVLSAHFPEVLMFDTTKSSFENTIFGLHLCETSTINDLSEIEVF